MFEGGKKLFPKDSIAQKALKIGTSRFLDKASVLSAIERYGFIESHEKYFESLTNRGFRITEENPHLFSYKEASEFRSKWVSGGRDDFFFKDCSTPTFFNLGG